MPEVAKCGIKKMVKKMPMQSGKFYFRMLSQTFPKICELYGYRHPLGSWYENLKTFCKFMSNRTQLNFINHLFSRLQTNTLCLEITSSLQNIRSFNIMVKEIWFSSKNIGKQDTVDPYMLKGFCNNFLFLISTWPVQVKQ